MALSECSLTPCPQPPRHKPEKRRRKCRNSASHHPAVPAWSRSRPHALGTPRLGSQCPRPLHGRSSHWTCRFGKAETLPRCSDLNLGVFFGSSLSSRAASRPSASLGVTLTLDPVSFPRRRHPPPPPSRTGAAASGVSAPVTSHAGGFSPSEVVWP